VWKEISCVMEKGGEVTKASVVVVELLSGTKMGLKMPWSEIKDWPPVKAEAATCTTKGA